MSCNSLLPAVSKRLTSLSTTAAYEWFTDWLPAATMLRAQSVMKAKAVSGNLVIQVAMQTAAVRPDDPDSPVTVASTQSGAGETCSDVGDVTSGLAGKYFVRFGIAYSLSSGSIGQGDVSLQVAYDACGGVAGSQTLALSTVSSTDSFLPVTGWLASISAEKVRAAVILAGNANIQWKLSYRTATTSVDSPNAWQTGLEAGYHGTGATNTGDLTPSVSTAMWVQFGIQYSSSSGGTLAVGNMSVSVATRKA